MLNIKYLRFFWGLFVYPAPAFATLFCYERSELENKKCSCGTTLFCYERSELENKKCSCGDSLRKPSSLLAYPTTKLKELYTPVYSSCFCAANRAGGIGHNSSVSLARLAHKLHNERMWSMCGAGSVFAPLARIGQALVRRRHSSLRLTTLASSRLLTGPATLVFDSLTPLRS